MLSALKDLHLTKSLHFTNAGKREIILETKYSNLVLSLIMFCNTMLLAQMNDKGAKHRRSPWPIVILPFLLLLLLLLLHHLATVSISAQRTVWLQSCEIFLTSRGGSKKHSDQIWTKCGQRSSTTTGSNLGLIWKYVHSQPF